ncbi:MAG: alpha/beta hydrolase [Bryobacteraceae bacterium]
MGLQLFVCLALSVSAAMAQTAGFDGHWLGALEVGPTKLRLALHIEKAADGSLSGKMDSIDQGASGIPLSAVTLAEKAVSFTVPAIRGGYKGTLNASADAIEGEWSQGPNSLPLSFKRTTGVVDTSKPQDPKKPYPYEEREVTYENPVQGNKLAGTLTLPKGRTGVPAVILISGSGPQNRDCAIFGHKLFLVLADHLTRKGIAVLRVDDRGVGGSTAVSGSTTLDFAKDVLAGVEFLKKVPEVNKAQIGLIGQSEGGIIAPVVASQSKDIAFIVMLAGPGVPGDQVLYEQAAAIIRVNGGGDEQIAANRQVQEKIFALVKSDLDDAAVREKVKDVAGAAQAASAGNPWFRTFVKLDPRDYLKKVSCPVLALNGELDLQVLPKQNLPEIEKALKEGGNKDFRTATLPKLNHLMQTAKTGSIAEYAQSSETMAPLAMNTISDWILEKTTQKGK